MLTIVLAVGFLFLGAGAASGSDYKEGKLGVTLGGGQVYYDVPRRRIGPSAGFSQRELLRYLLFRAHDLFDYHQGMDSERRKIADALRSASRGDGELWQLLVPVPSAQIFHADRNPQGTLVKYFEGELFQRGISQPRFSGGDAIAKQEGLVGECVAIAAHLSRDPSTAAQVARAIDMLVTRELSEGAAARGTGFWARPHDVLQSVSG